MMRTTIALIALLVVLAGCGQQAVVEDEQPAAQAAVTQTTLADMVTENGADIVQRSVRITDYQLDPESFTVPAGSVLELSLESDRNMVLSFPAFEEDVEITNTSVMTLTFMVENPGEFDYFCVEGCGVPLLGTIIAE